MKIAITGATGFIGQHVRKALAKTDHEVALVVREIEKVGEKTARELIVEADLNQDRTDWFELFGKPDVVLHLAWGGLPNYMDDYHVNVELPIQSRFLRALINSGLKKLVVTGTCYEYGMSSGALSEDQETNPNTPYGIAKNNLRKELFELQLKKDFDLTWARIFYPYGEGQVGIALYSQIRSAIANGEKHLKVGSCKQKLDFIAVEAVASVLIALVTRASESYIVNIGSGEPQTVFEFIQKQIISLSAELELLVGEIPDREYESPAFWADVSLIKELGFGELLCKAR